MIYIKIKNAGELAAKEMGLVGTVAGGVVPAFVAAKVDEAVLQKLAAALSAAGVVAELSLSETPARAGMVALGSAGVGFGIGMLVARSSSGRSSHG